MTIKQTGQIAATLLCSILAITMIGGCNIAQPSYDEADFSYYFDFIDYGQDTNSLKPIAEEFGENKKVSPNLSPEVLTYTEIPKVTNNAKGSAPICIVLPDLDLTKYSGPYISMDKATGLEVSAYYRVVANMITDEMIKVFVDSAGNIIQYETVNLGKYDALNLDSERVEYAQIIFRDLIHTTFKDVLQELCRPTQNLAPSVFELFTDDEGRLVIMTRIALKDTVVNINLYSVTNT